MTDKNLKLARRLEARVNAQQLASDRISWIRLLLFFGAIGFAAWGSVGGQAVAGYSLAGACAFGFVSLVFWHDRIERRMKLTRARLGLLRRESIVQALDWAQLPRLPLIFDEHELPPYFNDLDIGGERSLLRLCNLTISTLGWRKLLELVSNNFVDDASIRRRAALVRETMKARVFRKRFLASTQVFSGDAPQAIDSEELLRLIRHPLSQGGAATVFWVMLALQLLALALLASGQRLFWIPAAAVLVGHWVARRFAHSHHAYEHSISISHSLGRFRQASESLRRWSSIRSPRLHELLSPFRGEASAESQLKKLDRVVGMLGVRQNFLAHLFVHLFMPWDLFWTIRLESTRRTLEELLPVWKAALAEFEAIASVAELASCHPEWREAELIAGGEVFIEATDAHHPLIPRSRSVGNELRLDSRERCLLITGSNMSGKSTFLRAIGLNYVLARAGSPVAARSFRFSNASLHTALRVSDSLQDGLSSFYAEVKRLKETLEEARSGRPTFYLLDEIFRGTNNRERLQGSRAYLKEIVGTAAFGMVTTHDLELAALEGQIPAIANHHFREEIRGNEMIFSYRKARGPSPTTNALKVMELNGLPT